ncbi:MAG: tetratricopeptide repeat protein [Pseudomonadales bacterium]|nr:tetratricopeptide repeat protein [Pseudomonadales bacterium]
MYFREYNKTRFLVVDQNLKVRQSVEQFLKSFGAWYIDSATYADEAVDKCQHGLFDVVLCDYHLGDKDGQQVLEELRSKKLLKHTSLFIMASAETTKEMVLSAVDYQPDAYINKPITRDLLKHRFDGLLLDNEVLYDIKFALDSGDQSTAIYLCEEKILRNSKYRSWCEKTLANVLFNKADYDGAEAVYTSVIKRRPLIWAQMGLARIQFARQQYQEAEQSLQEILKASPNCLQAYDLLAEIFDLTKRWKDAQALLLTATKLAPRAVHRQSRLGELCLKNQDLNNALSAFQNAVEMGQKSLHDKPSNHIYLAHCIHETPASDAQPDRESASHQALDVLKYAEQKFTPERDVKLHASLVETRIHNTLQQQELMAQSLTQAQDIYFAEWSRLTPELTLEYAQTLFIAGKEAEAEMTLSQLQALYAHDTSILARIAELRDEPVAWQARVKAAELNKRGIKCFEGGQLEEAIQIFEEALNFSPRHPGLNLNLVQVLLKYLPKSSNPEARLAQCTTSLNAIKHINEKHRQFPRYQHLQGKLAQTKIQQGQRNLG